MRLYLKEIADSIDYEQGLPQEWNTFDLASFSKAKELYDYQREALKSALKVLYKYYHEYAGDKEKFYQLYKANGLVEGSLDIELKNNKVLKIFEDYSKDFLIRDGKLSFSRLVNRMGFWMATGSGKTLVIVKLIALLSQLMKDELIPKGEILFLTHRDDLLEQFKNHVKEYQTAGETQIVLHSLKDYASVKRFSSIPFREIVEVFYYRSDLIMNEKKDKIVDFRDYDNGGNWYILLDEAHKGDKEESKRQHYYTIMSRNGFLFNFSATFTEKIDYATCVYKFNLEEFTKQGYGKSVYISRGNLKALETKETSEREKQKTILKIMLLFTLLKRSKRKAEGYYHNPLTLVLVDSVNTQDSDLELFFRELERLAQARQEHTQDLLKQAKEELKEDLSGTLEFEGERLDLNLQELENLGIEDILEEVFNAKSPSVVEVTTLPSNNQELVFKLKTSDKPFALIKIGDIRQWLTNKLSGYEVTQTFEEKSVFLELNEESSSINILMGSRSFYEGWDSNRPNIILFINIGKGKQARKFVLQSIGRGVRIEPIKNKRRRLVFLLNEGKINDELYQKLEESAKALETLFVFGTKADNLKEIVETLESQKQTVSLGELFMLNPAIEGKTLLLPVYKQSEKRMVEESKPEQLRIHKSDYELLKSYFDYLSDKVLLVKHDISPKTLSLVRDAYKEYHNFFVRTDENEFGKIHVLVRMLNDHFCAKREELYGFKGIEDEIVHFKHIEISKEKLNSLEERIKKLNFLEEKIKKLNSLEERIKKLNSLEERIKKLNSLEEKINKVRDFYKSFEEKKKLDKQYGEKSREEYEEELEKLKEKYKQSENYEKLTIKYIDKHYYIPLMLSDDEKVNYIKHIIKTKSEVNFIKKLERYLSKKGNVFESFDWWFFSKIDETLDKVYIPYYDGTSIKKFKPDFIFWLSKGDEYTILFVDPKGTEHTAAYRKIDGYSKLFEEESNGKRVCKTFEHEDKKVRVKLLLMTKDISKVLEEYRKYWFETMEEFAQKLIL